MKRLKKWKFQGLVTLLLVLFLLLMPFQDYTERTFLMDSMNYPEDLIGTLNTDQGILSIPAGLGSFTLETGSHYFRQGTYEVTFNVTSSEAGNTVDVYDPNYLNADNTVGRVLAESEVSTDGQNIHLTFTIDDYAESIVFRVNCETPMTFESVYLLSERGLYCDPYIYAGLVVLASILFFLYHRKNKVRPEPLFLLLFAVLWSSLPTCFAWLSTGHDMYFHYGRLFNLSQDLSEGLFPVRFHNYMNRGFGYCVPMMYSEFFLYPFALLIRLGLSPMGCWHLLVLCANLATAYVAYYSFSQLTRSRRIGLITAVLYTLSMYRLINLYTRAAMGEVLATIFLPLVLLGMYHLFLGNSKKWWIAVLAFTGLFQSHVISTEIALCYCIVFALWNIRRLKAVERLIHLVLAGASTLLLNLWFILPFLDHMRYSMFVMGEERNLYAYSVYPAQFFDLSLNNPSADNLGRTSFSGSMPFSIGLVLLIGILLFVLLLIRKEPKNTFHRKLGTWCLVLGGLSLYASSVYFPWEAIQRIAILNVFVERFQFASRFLPFASLFLGITTALALYYFFESREQRRILCLLMGVLLIYTSGKYMSDYSNSASTFVDWDNQMDHAYDTDMLYLISDNGAHVSVRQMYAQDTAFQASEGVTITEAYRNGTNLSCSYENAAGGEVYIDAPIYYYPYLHAYDADGNLLSTSHGDLLRLRVALPDAENGSITIRMEMPLFYRIGDCISLATLVLLISGAVYLRKRRASVPQTKEEVS